MAPTALNGGPDVRGLFALQVVHDDDVAGTQAGHQKLLGISAGDGPVHGPVDQHGRDHAIHSHASHEGGVAPVSLRHRRVQPAVPGAALVKPGHLGREAAFIDEDQAGGVQASLGRKPVGACCDDIGTILLRRPL